MLKVTAPTEVEIDVETTEPEAPEPDEGVPGDEGDAAPENMAVEFDPYAVAIAAAEAVLMEDER